MNRNTAIVIAIVCLAAGAAIVFWGLRPGRGEPARGPVVRNAPQVNEWADAPPTRIRLTDVTRRGGIDAINHSGRAGVKEYLVEAVGVGPAWLDYDGDGLLDLFIPDGDVFESYDFRLLTDAPGAEPTPWLVPRPDRVEVSRDTLWRNQGDGTFQDVTASAGIEDGRWSYGATAFDYDADGRVDLFVANFGQNRLWRNNGDGTFTDVAPDLGLAGDPRAWSTCAAVGDIDDDGRLDIYVVQYLDPAAEVDRQRIDRKLPPSTPPSEISGRDCRFRSVPAYCGPRGLVGQHDVMYRQREDGSFEDVTAAWGLEPRVAKYGFTALMYDFNEDGLLDIYVANDSEENFMWEQVRDRAGNRRFRDTSDTLGVKYGHNLAAQASMGAAVGDFNQDGHFDMFVTNFSHDYNNLYLGHAAGHRYGTFFFKDRGLAVMGQAVFYDLSWGCGCYDFDNDGDLDLYFANGHVYKENDLFEKTNSTYEQVNALFECMDAPELGYREIGKKGQANAPVGARADDLFAGDGMAIERCSRGAAFADWNNDGRVEVFIQNMNEAPDLLLNTTEERADARWVKFDLSQPGGNREALGATVTVVAGELQQKFAVLRLTSFLGTDDPRIHVGLGSHEVCDVTVRWPGSDRATTEYKGLEAGALWVLDRESGRATERPLRAFDAR